MELDYFFDHFTQDAFRLETLPSYGADLETPGYRAFAAIGQLPSEHNRGWRDEVAAGCARGLNFRRLRLFSDELTAYERFEQASYRLSAEAGEQIRALRRNAFPPTHDFWFFDDRWIAFLQYDDAGRLVGADCHEASENERAMAREWIEVFYRQGLAPDTFG